MLENTKAELIEKYFDGRLSTQEKVLFESYLEQESFRSELLVYARCIDALIDMDYIQMKREMKGWNTDRQV